MKDKQLLTAGFRNLVNGFERELRKEGVADVNVNEHRNHITEFLRYAEDHSATSLIKITQSLAGEYVLHLQQERLRQRGGGNILETTVNKHRNTIRKFWKYLHAEGIKANAITLRQKKRYQQKERTVLTQEEIQWLYSVCDESAIGYRDRAMLAVYYGCGLRKSEGLKLLVTDIDFNKGRINLRGKTKTNRERYVMMSPTVQKQIEEYVYSWRDFYLAEKSTYLELFIGERGNPIHPETLACRVEDLWQRVKDRYGSEKHIGCHTLRHSLGTHLYMAGMKIEMIALMLGHRTLEATQLYIHSARKIKPENK